MLFKIPEWVPVLGSGSHGNAQEGACFMELASYLADEPWSDQPKCANSAMTAISVNVNDTVDDDDRQRLLPLVPRVIGTSQWDHNEEVFDGMVTWLHEWHEKIHTVNDGHWCGLTDYTEPVHTYGSLQWDTLAEAFECCIGETRQERLVEMLTSCYDAFDKAAHRDIDPVSVEQYRIYADYIEQNPLIATPITERQDA